MYNSSRSLQYLQFFQDRQNKIERKENEVLNFFQDRQNKIERKENGVK
jgi:hypothetical protein